MKFKVVLKIYRLLLIIVSAFTVLIVGAGSHGGINLQNQQTQFAIASLIVFFSTAFTVSIFLWETSKPSKSKRIVLIIMTSISTIFSLIILVKLLSTDLDPFSGWTYVTVSSVAILILLGIVTVGKAAKLIAAI
jgi:hypothetical protein